MTNLVPVKSRILIWEGTRKWPTTVYDIDGPENANLSAIEIFKDMKGRGLLDEPTLSTYDVDSDLVSMSAEVYATLPKSLKEIVDSHREQEQRNRDSYNTEMGFYKTAMDYIEGTQEFDPRALIGSPWGLLTMFRRKHAYASYAIFTETEYTYYAYEDEAAARV